MAVNQKEVAMAMQSGAALATNQRRVRGLRQLIGRGLKCPEGTRRPVSYSYTLSVPTASAGYVVVYESEGRLTPTAVWEPLQLADVPVASLGCRSVLVRVSADHRRLVSWRVHLPALVPVQLKWTFSDNALLFRHGSQWLTTADCVLGRPTVVVPLRLLVAGEAVQRAAGGHQLERLHRCQHERRRLELGVDESCRLGATLWPVVSESRLMAAQLERRGGRVRLLRRDVALRRRSVAQLAGRLMTARSLLAAGRQQLASQLALLTVDCDVLDDWRQRFAMLHHSYLTEYEQLNCRRRQLCDALRFIYPLQRFGATPDVGGEYSVLGIALPDADQFSAAPDRSVSVALAHVSDTVRMLAWILGVCLRYPIERRAADPVIRDHVLARLPDNERLFPLVAAGRDNRLFNYAVYLLNKNIAQLRAYCSLDTDDLRAMLPNLAGLLAVWTPAAPFVPSSVPPAIDALCGPPPAPRRRQRRLRLLTGDMDSWPASSPSEDEAAVDSSHSRSSVDSQKPSRSSVDSQKQSRSSADSQKHSRSSVDSQKHSRSSVDSQKQSRSSVDSQKHSRSSADSQEPSPCTPSPLCVTEEKRPAGVACGPLMSAVSANGDCVCPTDSCEPPAVRPADSDTDWLHVTSRMRMLVRPSSFKLVTKRPSD